MSLKGDEKTVVLVFRGVSVNEVVILRVEEAIFCDADAEEAIFCAVGIDEVAIFGGVGVDEVVIFCDADIDDRDAGIEEVAIFGGVGVDEVAIFRDADVDDHDASVEEVAIFGGVGVDEVAIFRDADVNDHDTGVEEAIFRDADVNEAIFCGVGVNEVAIFGGVGVEEAIFCGAGVDDSAIFGGGVFGFDGFLRVIIGRRKRIAANILDEYNNPSSSTSERTYAKFTTRKLRSKVLCYCNNCNGKMIDPRIKERHKQMNSLEPLNSDKAPTSQELVELIDSTISLKEP
ncbi:hypothetical protein RhiirA5_506244 [Rhizophagus irregularis]|uniref:Uncharacterized protein n=1 Tax=Rhizophagus irregularis TaxID=588596 RepID=A0A2N0NUT3_9GLOM|nr:hypothetical protein RhiirA5_506244 [Rhizophagus irregularis]